MTYTKKRIDGRNIPIRLEEILKPGDLKSVMQMVAEVGVSKSTINNWMRRWEEKGLVEHVSINHFYHYRLRGDAVRISEIAREQGPLAVWMRSAVESREAA